MPCTTRACDGDALAGRRATPTHLPSAVARRRFCNLTSKIRTVASATIMLPRNRCRELRLSLAAGRQMVPLGDKPAGGFGSLRSESRRCEGAIATLETQAPIHRASAAIEAAAGIVRINAITMITQETVQAPARPSSPLFPAKNLPAGSYDRGARESGPRCPSVASHRDRCAARAQSWCADSPARSSRPCL